MLALSLFCGVTMYLMGGADLRTSLTSGAAGGITEMMVFGMSIDADVAVIACVQVFRVVVFLALIPYLALIAKKVEKTRPASPKIRAPKEEEIFSFSPKEYVVLSILAFAGAAIGKWLKVPVGEMLGAMFACGIYAFRLDKRYFFDGRLRVAAQIGLGLAMGQRMTPQIIEQMRILFFPAIVVTGVMLAGCTLLAVFLYKTSEWDLTTCLLCSAPAGLNQIAAFAEEIGVDSFTASVFHTARIVGIVTLYPLLVLPLTS
jgi:membrane AbrB-like protein